MLSFKQCPLKFNVRLLKYCGNDFQKHTVNWPSLKKKMDLSPGREKINYKKRKSTALNFEYTNRTGGRLCVLVLCCDWVAANFLAKAGQGFGRVDKAGRGGAGQVRGGKRREGEKGSCLPCTTLPGTSIVCQYEQRFEALVDV